MELKWYNKRGKIYTDIQQNSMRYLFAEGITKLPVLYEKKEQCCGCSACYAVCPMSGAKRPEKARRRMKEILEERELQINIKIGTVVRSYVHTGAITMLPDEEGFFYPVIDGGICIKCHSCEKVCPVSRRKKDE